MNMGTSTGSSDADHDKDEDDSYASESTTSESSVSDSSASTTNATEDCVAPATPRNEDKRQLTSTADMYTLFDDAKMKKMAANILDDVKLNVLQQHQSHILAWLNESMLRNEGVVTLSQFCDMLSSKGVGRDEAVQAFQRFDTDGCGRADTDLITEGITHLYEEIDYGELNYATRTMQGCVFLPGFIDVFSRTDSISRHAAKLFQFITRNRAVATSFTQPLFEGFEETLKLRTMVAKHILEAASREFLSVSQPGLLCTDNAGALREIGKPYVSIEVSSNVPDWHKLVDNDTGSHWQSDGAARSHWIRLNMKHNVVIKQLLIFVSSHDQSYMPQEVVVSVGRRSSLREIKEVRIASHINGPVLLLENMKTYYPVVQINIKRCHSDGCDTRVHQIKVTGLKIIKESNISIADATARWYLQLSTATALACMPIIPQLCDVIVRQTKEALSHVPPMSLSAGSSDRPRFISDSILSEVNSFMQQLTTMGGDHSSSDVLICKLLYNLACCHLASILDIVICLLQQGTQKLETDNLAQSMQKVQSKFWSKGAKRLLLSYVDCDGGDRETDGAGHIHPREVLSYDPTSSARQAYQTQPGRRNLTMVFESSESVQITKLSMRTEKGGTGVKCGLIFLLPDIKVESLDKSTNKYKSSLNAVENKHLESSIYKRLDKYNSWTYEDYKQHKSEAEQDGLLSWFSMPDDWDDLDIDLPSRLIGRFLIVKFLQPRAESADRLGVLGVAAFGYSRCSVSQLEVMETADDYTKAVGLASHVLSFLLAVINSLENRRLSSGKLPYVSLSGLSISLITKFYKQAEQAEDVMILVKALHLIHLIFLNWSPEQEEELQTSLLFDAFSAMVNQPACHDQRVISIAKVIVVDGAKAFFPNDQMRKDQLLKMLKIINGPDELPSTSLVFESLCQFFSSVDPSALLNLPKHADFAAHCLEDKTELTDSSCLDVLDTLIITTMHNHNLLHDKQKVKATTLDSYRVLLKLLSSLQTSYLSWTDVMSKQPDRRISRCAMSLFNGYIRRLVPHYIGFMEKLRSLPVDDLTAMFNGEEDFIFSPLQQMIVFLSHYRQRADAGSLQGILQMLCRFVEHLKFVGLTLPQYCPLLDSSKWDTLHTEPITLNTWTEESPHNYNNNQHMTKVFHSPGASHFIVDFDSRCETERRYDYLEFTNAAGTKTRYDSKVNTESWPIRVEFKGSKLQMLFHSDQSNSEWGYKFTVTSKGIPGVIIHPLMDLQLSMAKLLGEICGQLIAMPPAISSASDEDEMEPSLVKSDLWRTLFRAGYEPTTELQRSFSGVYMVGLHEAAKNFLLGLLDDGVKEPFLGFLNKCRSRCRQPQEVGGAEITSAVHHIFAALIWHTSELRESLNAHVSNLFDDESSALSEGIFQAYNLAEQLRLPLMNQRQKHIEKGDSVDTFHLLTEITEKASLLLQFAALTKSSKSDYTRTCNVTKWKKCSLRRSENDILRRYEGNIPDKYPTFHSVLEFVLDSNWQRTSVEKVMKSRRLKASQLCYAYQYTCDYLNSPNKDHLLNAQNVLFLKSLLSAEKTFPAHYADHVDSCGLQLESQLRTQFYSLIRLLVKDALSAHYMSGKVSKNISHAQSVLQACLLHLLDMDWRTYDLALLKEIDLPRLLFNISKDNVAIRKRTETPTDADKEVKEAERNKQWYTKCQDSFTKWYESSTSNPTQKKEVQMFIARYCDLLDVEVTCDGCSQPMPGRRYRCLECEDMDLCVTCFTGGVSPGGEHRDDHHFIYFMYKCDACQAFITGERVHCTECDDFDLCFACHKNSLNQETHDLSHLVTRHPQVVYQATRESSPFSSYIHQHAWLQFAHVTLAMAGIVFERDQEVGGSVEMYRETASYLLAQSLSLITECLQQVSTVNKEVSVDPTSYREEVFIQHSQERIMGLLGSIVMLDEQDQDDDLQLMLTTVDFLKFIFNIASGNGGYDPAVQHLSLGLLAQLMRKACITGEVTDEAVRKSLKKEPSGRRVVPGEETVDFIIEAAAACLERQHGVHWCYSLMRLLQQLVHTPQWSEVIRNYMIATMDSLKDNISLKMVTVLLVVTGFPKIKSPGVMVKYFDYGTEEKAAVILKHFPDKLQSIIIDVKTRKKRTVKDELIACCSSPPFPYDENLAALITGLIKDYTNRLMKGGLLDVDAHWVLSLATKAFDQMLPSILPYHDQDVIKCIVSLAGMGTRLSKQWLIADLEVMSVMLYSRLESGQKVRPYSSSGAAASSSATNEGKNPFSDMDQDSRRHFTMLLDVLNMPMDQLRLVYDNHRERPTDLLQALHQLFQDDHLERPKSSPRLSSDKDKLINCDKMVDFGILSNSPADIILDSQEELHAVEEAEQMTQCLSMETESTHSRAEKRRAASAKLLKQDLSQLQQKAPPHTHLNKINLALSVLHARQALVAILANWSDQGPTITAQLLNCEDHNLALVLDVLNRGDDFKQFEKLVSRVMSCCKTECLQSVAESAAQFMQDQNFEAIIRQSPDKSKAAKDMLAIQGAAFLAITFDSSCHSDPDDCLVFSTSADMKRHRHSLSGSADRWKDFEVPGNTLYYKFGESDVVRNWKFTVVGRKAGSFYTGFLILNHILAQPSYCRVLRLGVLWRCLVAVVCKHTGDQRLKSVQLLLFLLKACANRQVCDAAKLPLDLCLLKPLWKLYQSLSAKQAPDCTPPILRALTELFLAAEDIAVDWSVSTEYTAALIDPSAVLPSFMEGLTRVVALGLAISYSGINLET